MRSTQKEKRTIATVLCALRTFDEDLRHGGECEHFDDLRDGQSLLSHEVAELCEQLNTGELLIVPRLFVLNAHEAGYYHDVDLFTDAPECRGGVTECRAVLRRVYNAAERLLGKGRKAKVAA